LKEKIKAEISTKVAGFSRCAWCHIPFKTKNPVGQNLKRTIWMVEAERIHPQKISTLNNIETVRQKIFICGQCWTGKRGVKRQ
jgi:hypothetical protein